MDTVKNVSCVKILSPGGYDRLSLCAVDAPTRGPNIKMQNIPESELVVIKTAFTGINYADICIRWGLYTSANQFVGFPICPGFEFSGEVVKVGSAVKRCKVGDKVWAVSMFGGYSSHVEVPQHQVYPMPKGISMEQAAGFPGVTMTAWMAIDLSRPTKGQYVLVHSAAGGVGSMLVQMLKSVYGCKVVGVVGSTHKIDYCTSLGCDLVIDKSKEDLWAVAKAFSPNGKYKVIFDANGVETLQASYDHLDQVGKLVVYGFHSMLPKASKTTGYSLLDGALNMASFVLQPINAILPERLQFVINTFFPKEGGWISPLKWLNMGVDAYLRSPKFNPLDMVPDNKSVLTFNLSFLFGEIDLMVKENAAAGLTPLTLSSAPTAVNAVAPKDSRTVRPSTSKGPERVVRAGS